MGVFKTVKAIDRHAALKIFGGAICEARKKRGLTQEKLADKMQMSRTQLANIELGRSWIGIELFVMLTLELKMTFDAKFWE